MQAQALKELIQFCEAKQLSGIALGLKELDLKRSKDSQADCLKII